MAISLPIPTSVPAVPLDSGAEMYAFAAELYPICRSITGNGVRRLWLTSPDMCLFLSTRFPAELRHLTGRFRVNGILAKLG